MATNITCASKELARAVYAPSWAHPLLSLARAQTPEEEEARHAIANDVVKPEEQHGLTIARILHMYHLPHGLRLIDVLTRKLGDVLLQGTRLLAQLDR
eukprot:CAMPEP_0182603356 /NCGR_PEP_ID=MMETSP1324-20130603/92453_1 /TAXON_ID=236786 /ORGANISM="Florenciella sp., Strain RCC1587" /LENGTH=97 /DNA_ID=CAMNT_0024821287 /DNA_START=1045 /DNA_END=1339 /DNA_ORIENTATION=+